MKSEPIENAPVRLESVLTGNRYKGTNPFLSAIHYAIPLETTKSRNKTIKPIT